MTRLAWSKRPPEEAHLFNPAFCGLLASEFVRAFFVAGERKAVPVPLVFCSMPLILHADTRARLPHTTTTSLYTWLERHPDALVGFPKRAGYLVPHVRDAIMFAAARSAVAISADGNLQPGSKKIIFRDDFLTQATPETREIALASRFVGRWFASAGDVTTIMAGWGVTV